MWQRWHLAKGVNSNPSRLTLVSTFISALLCLLMRLGSSSTYLSLRRRRCVCVCVPPLWKTSQKQQLRDVFAPISCFPVRDLVLQVLVQLRLIGLEYDERTRWAFIVVVFLVVSFSQVGLLLFLRQLADFGQRELWFSPGNLQPDSCLFNINSNSNRGLITCIFFLFLVSERHWKRSQVCRC